MGVRFPPGAHNIMENNNFTIDFIGIGAPKSGTTWLSECLREHPDVCMSEPKEVHFFNKTYAFYWGQQEWKYPKGIEWYQDHWQGYREGQKRGEYSVFYLQDEGTPELIYTHFPKTKLIVCLRHPRERLYSHYLHPKQNRDIPSLTEVIEKYPEFVAQGFYDEHIKRYLKYFSEDQLHIVFYEDIKKHPKKILEDVYTFIGVKKDFEPPSLHRKVSPLTGKYKLVRGRWAGRISRILDTLYLKSFAKSIMLTRLQKKSSSQYEACEKEVGEILKKIYLTHIEELERMTKKDLSSWKD